MPIFLNFIQRILVENTFVRSDPKQATFCTYHLPLDFWNNCLLEILQITSNNESVPPDVGLAKIIKKFSPKNKKKLYRANGGANGGVSFMALFTGNNGSMSFVPLIIASTDPRRIWDVESFGKKSSNFYPEDFFPVQKY